MGSCFHPERAEQPGYSKSYTTFHYVLARGAIENAFGRFVAVADSGFWPQQYFINFDGGPGGSACSLIPPKGYCWASAAPIGVPAPPGPPPAPAAPPAPAPGAPAPGAPAQAGIPCVIGRNGPKPYTAHTMDDKLSHAAHEVTMWLPARTLKDGLQEVLATPARPDTTLGHAINSASLGRVNHQILLRLAAKLGVDVSDIN
jgi:hypothetical protein